MSFQSFLSTTGSRYRLHPLLVVGICSIVAVVSGMHSEWSSSSEGSECSETRHPDDYGNLLDLKIKFLEPKDGDLPGSNLLVSSDDSTMSDVSTSDLSDVSDSFPAIASNNDNKQPTYDVHKVTMLEEKREDNSHKANANEFSDVTFLDGNDTCPPMKSKTKIPEKKPQQKLLGSTMTEEEHLAEERETDLVTCTECNGVTDFSKDLCKKCNGKGKIEPECYRWHKCPQCNGKGKTTYKLLGFISIPTGKCSRCNGGGRLQWSYINDRANPSNFDYAEHMRQQRKARRRENLTERRLLAAPTLEERRALADTLETHEVLLVCFLAVILFALSSIAERQFEAATRPRW